MSVLFAVLLFSILIFVHELGHFATAKWSGVQVNEFAIFMGPAIWKKQIGETLYSIRCIPIGGYCAMEGEDGGSDNPRSFGRAAWWKRLIILLAGSAMNFLAGLVLLAIVFFPAERVAVPVIDSFEPYNTVSGEAGLQAGDRILEIDGERIYVYSDFSLVLTVHPGEIHDLLVERNGREVEMKAFRMEKHLEIGEDGSENWMYGINFSLQELDLAGRLEYVWLQCVDTVRIIRLSFQMLLSGQAGFQDLSGPVGIVSIMSERAEESETAYDALLNLLYFGGFIAINLAVMNLLPIPALDGGRAAGLLIVTALEALSGRRVDPRYEAWIHNAGMILLLGLMAVIMFKDILFLFRR